MVALHVEHPLHRLRVRERRRVEDDEIDAVAIAGLERRDRIAQPREDVGADDPVRVGVDAVQAKVAFGPVGVRVRQVDAFGPDRAAARGVHREARGVGEQVQEALAARALPDEAARHPVVQEEAGIEIAVEVEPEAMTALAHDDLVLVDPGRAVLGRLVATDPLSTAVLDGDPVHGDVERLGGDLDHMVDPLAVLGFRLLPTGVDFLELQIAGTGVAVEATESVALEAIDDQRKLGNVAVVDAIRVHVRPPCPLAKMARVLRKTVLEVREVGHGRIVRGRLRDHAPRERGSIASCTLRSTTKRRAGRAVRLVRTAIRRRRTSRRKGMERRGARSAAQNPRRDPPRRRKPA